MKQTGIILLFILSCAFSSLAQQSTKHSNDQQVKSPNYKVGQSNYTTGGRRILIVFVAVDKRSFNSERMLALAQRLKLDYSNEEKLSVYFFDNFTAAKRFSAVQIHNPTYEKDVKAMRGYYSFNKTTTIEFLEYSPQRGKAEVRIDINNLKTHQ